MIPGMNSNPGGPGVIYGATPTGEYGLSAVNLDQYNQSLAQINAANAQAKSAYYGSLYPSLASMGKNYADMYGQYAGGLQNVAQSMANENVGRMGAYGMAEAARQTAAGNIGSAALGAYGGAANSAMNAWAQNQTAYNKAASDMHASNQQAMSTYGVGRSGALQGLGQSYADMTGKLGAANQITNLSGDLGGFSSGGGGGFSASGPSGPIASGSYGSTGMSGGGTSFGGGKQPGPGFDRIAQQGFGGLNSLQQSVMSGDITGSLDNRANAGLQQLDNQHYSSRMMPSQMLDQSLAGVSQLGGQGYRSLANGMNQFYGNAGQSRPDFGSILSSLNSGYGNANQQLNNFWSKGFQPMAKYS